jgi:predicted small lipoprotein YifL
MHTNRPATLIAIALLSFGVAACGKKARRRPA